MPKVSIALLCLLTAFLTPRLQSEEPAAINAEQIVQQNAAAMLVISGARRDTGKSVQASGFCVDTKGLVLSTAHQVLGLEKLRGRLHDGREVSLSVIEADPDVDLALLGASAALPAAVTLGDSTALRKGAALLAIASPNGLDFSVSRGIVSSTKRAYRDMPVLQTDLPAGPGSSGGAVFDRYGRLVGMIMLNLAEDEHAVFVNPISNAAPLLMRHDVLSRRNCTQETGEYGLVPVEGLETRSLYAVEAFNRGVAAREPARKVAEYKTAVLLLPEFYEAQFNLGLALAHEGQYDAAEAAFRVAARLRPEAPEPLRNLGRLYIADGRLAAAEKALARARARAPDAAQSYNDLGEVKRRQRKFDEARKLFEQALARDAGYAPAHYNLGLILSEMGAANAAAEHFARYLALKPEADDTEQVRIWIAALRQRKP